MLYVIIAAAVVVAIGLLAFAFGRRSDVVSDVERFRRARAMTTGWSNEARPASAPAPAPPTAGPDE